MPDDDVQPEDSHTYSAMRQARMRREADERRVERELDRLDPMEP